jgi:hypothetical protein
MLKRIGAYVDMLELPCRIQTVTMFSIVDNLKDCPKVLVQSSLIFQAGGYDNNSRNLYEGGVDLSYSITLDSDKRILSSLQIGPSVQISTFSSKCLLSNVASEKEEEYNAHSYILHWIAEVRCISCVRKSHYLLFSTL